MRKKTARRMLAILHGPPFEPTDEMRELIKLLVFNGTPEARMAEGLHISMDELRFHFADELGYSQDRLLAETSARVIALMRQTADPGIALRAAELMLKTRLPAWREPKEEEPRAPAAERIEGLTLEEVERELARRGIGAAAAGAEDPEAAPEPDIVVH